MATLIQVVGELAQWNADTSLATHIPLSSITLSPDYNLARWMADPKNKDSLGLILAWKTKVPPGDLGVPPDIEYHYADQKVHGLGRADFRNGLCVSLDVAPDWHRTTISITRTSVADEDAKAGEPDERQVEVPHCARIEHTASHEEWWRRPHQRLPVVLREGRHLRHGNFPVIVECLESGYFYSVDRDSHGGSAFKCFKLQQDGLHWVADLDADGDPIPGKHKGPRGLFIPRGKLSGI
jgi:hypothetical protein